MIVTIDGPAGTGKSTVARRLATSLEFEYLDTGAMYRMIALHVLCKKISPEDRIAVARVAEESQIDFRDGDAYLNGQKVSDELRQPDVAVTASVVAQVPRVREVLVQRQREIAIGRDIVCEGRDQGTIVFPDAGSKFFLTASAEIRARRRLKELEAQGKSVTYEQLLTEQNERDERDENRKVAPLKAADDAEVIDTSELTIDQVVELLKGQIQRKSER